MNKSEIVEKFKSGKIGIFPTDTAFGIGCRIDYPESIEKIYRIRKRPSDKSLIALAGSIEMVNDYVLLGQEVREKLVDKYWPGGLTIVFNCKKEKIPQNVRSGGATLALRIPGNEFLREIIQNVGVPIVAPSANYSGEKTPYTFEEVDKKLISEVDFVVNGVCTIKGVSTIVDTTVTPWKVLRQGVVEIN